MDIPEKIDNSETTTETTTSLPAGINLAAAQRNKEKYQKQIDAANDLIYERLPELTKVALAKAITDKDTRLLMELMNRALGKPVEVKEINTNEQMRRNIDEAREQLKEQSLDDLTREYQQAAKLGPQSDG
jgi:hypothetical protein